jgi:hypothetical protein
MPVDAIAELVRLGFPFPFAGGDHTDAEGEKSGDDADKDGAKPDAEGKDDGKKKPEFNDEQAAEVRRLSQKAAKDAADKARAEERQKIADEKKKADEEAERKKAEEAGEFDKVKASLTKERDDVAAERDQLRAQNETLLKLVTADVENDWKAVPAEVKETYDGKDDDLLAKKQHMQRNAKIIARLKGEKKPGVPKDPDPDGKTTDIKNVLPKGKMY